MYRRDQTILASKKMNGKAKGAPALFISNDRFPSSTSAQENQALGLEPSDVPEYSTRRLRILIFQSFCQNAKSRSNSLKQKGKKSMKRRTHFLERKFGFETSILRSSAKQHETLLLITFARRFIKFQRTFVV